MYLYIYIYISAQGRAAANGANGGTPVRPAKRGRAAQNPKP